MRGYLFGKGLLIVLAKKIWNKKRYSFRPAIFVTGIVVFLGLSFVYLDTKIIPTIVAISETKILGIANKAVVDAVHSRVDILLEDKNLLDFHTDSQGKLLYVQTNAACLAQIQADALYFLQETITNLERFELRIPLGQILGSRIFATKGPKIKVHMCPYGQIDIKVADAFVETGINQVKYDLRLKVSFALQIIIPLVSSKTHISIEIPLASVIIPGKVPDTYITVPLTGI